MTQSVHVGAAVPNPRVSFITKTIVCNGIIHASESSHLIFSVPPFFLSLSLSLSLFLSSPHSQTVKSIFVTNGTGRLESCVGLNTYRMFHNKSY